MSYASSAFSRSVLLAALLVVSSTRAQEPPSAPKEVEDAAEASAGFEDLEAAKTAFRGGDYPAALEAAERALEASPNSPTAHYIAGTSLLRLGRIDEVESHLKAVEEVNPRWAGLQFQFGFLDYTRAETAAGEEKVEDANRLYRNAAARFASELERSPDLIAALSSRAVALSKAGDVSDAVAAHEAWIAASPTDPTPVLSLGTILVHAGRTEEALALFARLPDPSPEAVHTAAKAWGSLAYEGPDPELALPFLEKALATIPTDTRSLAMIAGVAAQSGDLERTARELTRFLDAKPKSDEAEQVSELIRSRYARRSDPTRPKVIRLGTARYPREAMSSNIRTTVSVLARIGVDGKAAEILPLPNRIWDEMRAMGFEEAAFEAVRRGRFEPGTDSAGVPAARYIFLDIPFEP